MTVYLKQLVLATAFLFASAGAAYAQGTAPAAQETDDDWDVAIYPVLAWVPLGIGIDLDVPPIEGGGGGGGGSAEIIDSRFDGAFLGGFTASKSRFRIDADGLWAAFGGDRPELPFLRVDLDAIYFHVAGGVEVVDNLYLTGGVRRLALKYNVVFGDQPEFERKPGLWDPLLGVGYHRVGDVLEVHASFEGGGFGVGSDVDLAGLFRIDWKPVRHFGLTVGYNYLYLKIEDDFRNRVFTATQALHGPIVGIGLYF